MAAEGLWKKGTTVRHDDIVVYEVMARTVERKGWKKYQRLLQAEFVQESIVIRAQEITLM